MRHVFSDQFVFPRILIHLSWPDTSNCKIFNYIQIFFVSIFDFSVAINQLTFLKMCETDVCTFRKRNRDVMLRIDYSNVAFTSWFMFIVLVCGLVCSWQAEQKS